MNHSMRGMQLRYRVIRKTLVIDLRAIHRVLSSAPRGGGLIRSRSILNHQVGATGGPKKKSGIRLERPQAVWDDPARYLRKGRIRTERHVAVGCSDDGGSNEPVSGTS